MNAEPARSSCRRVAFLPTPIYSANGRHIGSYDVVVCAECFAVVCECAP